jgi:type IV secretory pathway component VirB8
MLQDSLNLFELNTIEKRYNSQMSEADKEGYKKASIIIHSVENVNDSIVIVNYSNSFKNKQMPVKVVLKDKLWQIDFNYTFTGNL